MHLIDDTSTVATSGRSRGRRLRHALTPTALIATVAGVVYLASSTSLIDDAYITLSYAKNLGLHMHWGLAPGEVANTATSPLHVLLLAALIAVVRHGMIALGLLVIACAVITEYGLRRVARSLGLPRWFGAVATVLCLFNPLVVSSMGMEILLGAALTALLLAAAVERRPWWFGVFAGLLVLTRMDLVVVVGVIFLMRKRWWLGWYKSIGVALLIALSWWVTSWFLLGSAVPDTFIIKTAQEAWGDYSFGNGIALYFDVYPAATVLSCLPVIAGLLTVIYYIVAGKVREDRAGQRLRPLMGLPVAAIAHFTLYTILGVPPYHWYYGPAIVLMTMFLAAAVSIWFVSVTTRLLRLTVALPLAALMLADVSTHVRSGVPREYAPIQTNHASAMQYRQIGLEVGSIVGESAVTSRVEIGTIAYYCSCRIYDYFSDRGYFTAMLKKYLADVTPFAKTLLEWNYTHFARPPHPAPTAYTLVETVRVPPSAVASWPIYSPWSGPWSGTDGYVALLRTG